jgi:hypothetical protein
MSIKRTPDDTGRKAVNRRTAASPQPMRATSGTGLSKLQKARISQVAREAFDHQDRLGLIETEGASDSARVTAWRRKEQIRAVRIESLTNCGNQHFRPLLAHFLCLAGRDDQAFNYQLKTGRVKDHGALDDTHENRETQRTLIVQELTAHAAKCSPGKEGWDPIIAAKVTEKGGLICANYVIAIAKSKCKGRSLDSLTATELRQILYTIRNRIAAREGRGATWSRNNKQRAKKA